jgi:hypothetical protein
MAVGSVATCERVASGAVREPVEALAVAVQGATVAHTDETGWRLPNERAWLWVAVTEVGTLFVEHDERSHAASRALLDDAFEGYLVSDRWSAYEGYAPPSAKRSSGAGAATGRRASAASASWGASCRSWRRCVRKGERFSGIWSKRARRGCSRGGALAATRSGRPAPWSGAERLNGYA